MTDLRWQRKPTTQIFTKNRRFSPFPGNSSIWRAQETAENRRFSQKTELQKIFAENRRKPQIGLRHLRSVTFSSALRTAFDGTSDEKSLWFLCVHCVEGAFGASSRGTPKMKNGAPQDDLKNGRGRGWVIPSPPPRQGGFRQ